MDSVVDLLASVKTALTRTGKPIASFLFVGPTGVGKTELAKVLAEFMFGSRDRLIRFDMSEFAGYYDVERLLGSGYFSEGLLTSAVRKEPFCVLLFDEIEKAHPSFYDLLLQILSEGRLSDHQGKLVNFCSTIIIMTSNIGAARIQGGAIGWRREVDTSAVVEAFMTAVRKYFNPELFNRIDEVIPFLPLDSSVVRSVVEREIALLRQREGLKYRRVDLQILDEVLDYLATTGYDTRYGARQLQRTIREELILPLARKLNEEDFEDQLLVVVALEQGKINIRLSPDPLGLELLLEELEKTNYADHAGALRREIYALKESHYYVKLLSELDQMERLKQKKSDKFWQKGEKVSQYTGLLRIKDAMNGMIESIEQLESDLCMACLQLKPYVPALTDKIQEWQEAFFELKIDLYTQLNPGADTCKFGIYGAELTPVVRVYLDLFQSKGFEVTAHSIWFREKYYNEEIEIKKAGAIIRKKREEYLREPYHPGQEIDPAPPKNGDICFGVEFLVEGKACLLYLQGEDGFQRWEFDDQDSPLDYKIQVGDKNTTTPAKIHRQDFYKRQNIRRSISRTQIRDSLLKINREYNKGELALLIREELDRLFDLLLEEIMS